MRTVKIINNRGKALVLFGLAALAIGIPAVAEGTSAGGAKTEVTADALLKVLVRKGVLTEAEAAEVRAEAEREAAVLKAPASISTPKSPEPPSRTQITGYLQARAVYQEGGAPENEVFVRRARVSIRSISETGRFQMTLDGARNETNVKDAFVAWNPLRARDGRGPLTLQLGQFIRPFGIELERSSSAREFPERPVGWSVLFPGSYDIGASAAWGAGPDTSAVLALMNGPGAGSRSTPTRDPDNYKDVLARVRHTVRAEGRPKLDLALSAYLGRQRLAGTAAVPAQTGYVDANGNGVQDAGEPTVVLTPGREAVPAVTGDRDRYGIAAWAHDMAGGEVRGEYIRARDLTTNLAGGPRLATADAEAWYLMYLHPVGSGASLGARYDIFDPDLDDDARLDGDGEVKTLGFVALRDLTENLRLTLSYERPRTTRYVPAEGASATSTSDVLTLQGQYRF